MTAIEAFDEYRNECQEHVNRLQRTLDALGHRDASKINWGAVGSMRHLANELAETEQYWTVEE